MSTLKSYQARARLKISARIGSGARDNFKSNARLRGIQMSNVTRHKIYAHMQYGMVREIRAKGQGKQLSGYTLPCTLHAASEANMGYTIDRQANTGATAHCEN